MKSIVKRGIAGLAVAAAANAATLTVARRPRIALLATGDELVLTEMVFAGVFSEMR